MANQILRGATMDLFLSANRQRADDVAKAGLAIEMVPFVSNNWVIIACAKNPGQIHQPAARLDLH
jgi:ABC-type molybdate transport system substrate-binding protein